MGRMAVAVMVSLWVIPISILVNRIVPDPYMDEIFHIPQAQKYCKGNFRDWDPMITTPPGLYYLSIAYIASLFPGMWFMKAASSFFELCSTPVLRSTNGALAIICSVLIYDILIHLRPTLSGRRATFYTVIIALYPVHWFFTFLYYTDVASVTAVLAMYLASLKRHYWISATLGASAVLLRQTNVIWMLFVAATAAIDHAEALTGKQYVRSDEHNTSTKEKNRIIDKRNTPANIILRKRRHETFKHNSHNDTPGMKNGPSVNKLGFVDELQAIFLNLWCWKWKILMSFAPFGIVLASFITFVIWNGSIVLGAKEAHVVSPHFAQIMYVGLVSAAAIAPAHFSLTQAIYLGKSFSKNKTLGSLQWLIALVLGFTAVHLFSIAHPYLLADNRHYTFYIWRKVINACWAMKYVLVPLYVYSWFSIHSVLEKSQKKFLAWLFFLACAAVLVPAPLIEFRYYSIPYLFLILHSQIDDNISWVLIAVLYVLVDIFTMVMFLYHPFHWAHELGTQRFIW